MFHGRYPAKFLQPSLRRIDFPNPFLCVVETSLQCGPVWLEPRIQLDNAWRPLSCGMQKEGTREDSRTNN
jgi:hypothetical protein